MSPARLAAIAAAALLAISGAWWLSTQRHLERAVETGSPVLPDLEASINDVTSIQIARGDGTQATLRRDSDGWRVVERNHAANSGQVRKLLLDLAALAVVEQKTSDPKRYAVLGVDDVKSPAAKGALITLQGKTTTTLIIGKPEGARAVYVRRSDQAGSVLATPQIVVDADPRRWLDTLLIDVKPNRIRRVAITVRDEPTYIAERSPGSQGALALTAVPRGREVADPAGVDALAGALAELRFDDVEAAGASSPASLPTGSMSRFDTVDGLTLDIAERQAGSRRLITLVATGSTESSRTEAERINARTRGLEFEIAGYKASVLFRRLEELLKSG